MKKYKQLSYEELVKIETLLEEDFKPKEIAIKLGEELSKTEYGQYLIKRADQWK